MNQSEVRQMVDAIYPQIAPVLEAAADSLYRTAYFSIMAQGYGITTATQFLAQKHENWPGPMDSDRAVIEAAAKLFMAAADDSGYELTLSLTTNVAGQFPGRCPVCGGLLGMDCLCDRRLALAHVGQQKEETHHDR